MNLRRCLVLCGLVLSLQSAFGFSFWGQREGYQTPALGYDRLTTIQYPGTILWTIQLTGAGNDHASTPKNLGEEYRMNTRYLYYTFDQNFLDYFGSNGVYAVDQAIAILNNLTNVSDADLSQFPLKEIRRNHTASALHLFDLKSAALELLVERMGLADPERWTWTLRNRQVLTPPGCPYYNFSVIQRNFDPDTLTPTKYVNGNFFTYEWLQFCSVFDDRSEPIELKVDSADTYLSAVASTKIITPRVSYLGYYHTGLTRDDMAGLNYLLNKNNLNVESAGNGTITFITNNTTQLLFTSNLTELISAALTNDAAALSALFPNLQIAQSLPFFTNVVTTNFFTYLTNYPQDPYGTTRSITVGVVSTNIQTWYSHQFLNVFVTPTVQLVSNLTATPITGHLTTSNLVTVLTTNISLNACPIGSPYTGLPCTNISLASFWSNGIAGDFFILPSNLCSVALISTQLIQNISVTNATVVATNATGTTNAFNESFSQTTIYNFNRYVYVVKPVVCPVDSVALRRGIERIQFIRRDFDSLLGQFFTPTNSTYTLTAVTNSANVTQHISRFVTQPDILFSASDIDPNLIPIDTINQSTPILNTSNSLVNLAGPGTIEPTATFEFNKVGPIYLNTGPFFTTENSSYFYFQWGSFDGSTNTPIVYPTGASINDLINQVLMEVTTLDPLPSGTRNLSYNPPALTGTGGQPPYSWDLSPSSGALPAGVTLNTAGVLSGTPTVSGTFGLLVRMTDVGGRSVERGLTLTINP